MSPRDDRDESELPDKRELRDGRYVILRHLGEGGQGKTYEAEDRGLMRAAPADPPGPHDPAKLAESWDRYVTRAKKGEKRDVEQPKKLVAIKCFRLNKAKAWKDVELAEREARTLASLDHPRLPKYIEHFEEEGALYLVMEKIDGESLAAIRSRRGDASFSPNEVIKMMEDVADALRYLHGASNSGNIVVHRDIKPGNVIRRPDGSYALVDFGAVRDRLKQGGSTVVGTFGYMAPEQFQGRASPKSDLYGLAATALAMLTGTEPEDLPHEGLGIDVAKAVPGGTPKHLVKALSAMLIPDPDRRVDSIDEALAFLKVGNKTPQPTTKSAPEDAAPPALSKKERRRLERDAERAAKKERRRARYGARSSRPVPPIPRAFAQLGLGIAIIATWIALGIGGPLVFAILSLFFGPKMREIGKASVHTAQRTTRRMRAASMWLAGHRIAVDTETEGFIRPNPQSSSGAEAKVRVRTDLDDVKAVTETQAQALAIRERARARNAGHELTDEEEEEALRAEIEAERQQLMKKRLSSIPPKSRRT